jgi:hypothetical protein
VKRPRVALADEEDDDVGIGKTERVSHFDKTAGGAVDDTRKKEDIGPLVIQPQANRDWKQQANLRKRQKSGLPVTSGGNGVGGDLDTRMKDVEARVEASKPKFGLNTFDKPVEGTGEEVTSEVENGVAAESLANNGTPPPESPSGDASVPPKTDDELAMDALLGKTSSNKQLVIESNEAPMNEEDAFSHDFASAPPQASLDDYARVPVEQFGAALLRGMGWKDGEGIGKQKGQKLAKDTGKLPERRANLLGIGAKEDAAVSREMGAWGKAAKGKDVKIYNPVLLRDKQTGQMYTEEELEKKKLQDERDRYEMEFERKERERERVRERERSGRSTTHDSRDRRRDRNPDESPERSRDRDDRRHREKSRRAHDRRSDEQDHHRRREPDRSRRPRDHSDRHRERDGDRDRDRRGGDGYRDRDRDRDRERKR